MQKRDYQQPERKGEFWDLWIPELRPRPYTHPHPFLIRACSGESSIVEMARLGRPFLMNVQSDEVTCHRLGLCRDTMAASGFDEAHVARPRTDLSGGISSSVRQMKRLCVLAFRCSRRNASSAARCARVLMSAVKVWRSRGNRCCTIGRKERHVA